MKTVIFDLDGTLVYQPPGIILKSNVKIVEYLDPDYPDPIAIVKEVYSETTNNGGLLVTKADQIRCMAEKLLVDADDDRVNECLKIFLNSYLNPLSLHDDCKATLEKLEANGIRMGIATNGAHDIQPETIKKFEIENYFDFFAISSVIKSSKDMDEFIRYLIERCGIVPDETIVVGDTLPDFLLAKGLETMVYIVNRGQEISSEIPDDIVIPTLTMIPEILSGMS